MITILGLKYSLHLLPEQKMFIAINCGNQRFLYNSLWSHLFLQDLSKNISYEKNFHKRDSSGKFYKERCLTSGHYFDEEYLREQFFLLREEFPFLKLSQSSALQYTISYLSHAVKDGLNPRSKKKMPQFKKKNVSNEGFRLTNPYNGIYYERDSRTLYVPQMKNFMKKYMEQTGNKYSETYLEKLCHFKLNINKKSREKGFPKDLKSYTFSRNSSGEYFVSSQEEVEIKDSILNSFPPEELLITAFDMGFKDKLIYENGEVEKRVKHFDNKAKELAHEQKLLAKYLEKFKRNKYGKTHITEQDKKNRKKSIKKDKYKQDKKAAMKELNKLTVVKDYPLKKVDYAEFGKFYRVKKRKEKIAKINRKIANRRNDENHKLSRKIVDNSDIICLENLNFSGMQKLFGKSILDLGLGDLVQKLKYKADNQGKVLIFVDRYFPSSKTCSCCGYKNNELKLSDREWKCPKCETLLHRDENAAKNIRKEGMRVLEENLLKDIAAGETIEKHIWVEKLKAI